MKTLAEVMEGIAYRAAYSAEVYPEGIGGVEVSGICLDSREAAPGALFCCFAGQKTDGHTFAASAYGRGARVFLCEHDLAEAGQLPDGADDAICLVVGETRYAMAQASANFWGNPQRELKILGITGTKGKTTIAYMVEAILRAAGHITGIMGTLGAAVRRGNGPDLDVAVREIDHTTPEAPQTFEMLRWFADSGCEYVVMEVSSHALWQHRVLGIHFISAGMTVMGVDHLGIGGHPSYEHYMQSKELLFTRCDTAVLNAEDWAYPQFAAACMAPNVMTYSLEEASNIVRSAHPLKIAFDALGTHFEMSLPGDVSVRNALCATKMCMAPGVDVVPEVAAKGLADVVIPGRFEVIPTAREDVMFVVDYAHNRVSVEAAVDALRAMGPARVVCLFGSIGDRMQVRRRELAEASKKADFVVLTSDDPGFEDPESIADEIEGYLGDMPHVKIVSRWDAVAWVAEHAQPGDMVLLAGKGHEHYMNIKGEHVPFCERDILQRVCGLPKD
ncbi:MAG: UDP-N-acetylmuramoyl-L-alanyl-D-glutamate--2,6-diaminopimelate ligase [Eggerthellaceae bacterium]|nr:UDP-N-acetylmuramoyl-L-alanyl-D-glutamate--2,6-diaminopimelate ligase [Eggerthellaceae bacterium]